MEKPSSTDTPFIHPPDTMDDNKGNGLFCFIDNTRPCAADCMAYQVEPPAGPDYRGQQWANCLLLINAHRVGKHLTILAQATDGLIRRSQVQAADHARASQQPPPAPR